MAGIDISYVVPPGAGGGGGGGSGSVVQQTSVLIPHAQILTLPTIPVLIIPAPGVNKLAFPVFAYYRFNWTANYTNITAGVGTYLFVGNIGFNTFLTALNQGASNGSLSQLLAAGASADAIQSFQQSVSNSITTAGAGNSSALVPNTAYHLLAINAGGNFTGGNVANSLLLTVFHVVIDV